MKFVFLPAAALAAAIVQPAYADGCAGAPGAGMVKLTTTVQGVRSAKGEIAVTLYGSDKRRFLAKGGKLDRVRTRSVAPTASACFWVKPGTYAVAVYHDENADRDFNRSLFKVKEGFAFSNDAPTTLGIPSYEKVRFQVPADGASISMKMRYPD